MEHHFRPGDIVEFIPIDILQDTLGFPIEELRRFEGIQFTIAGIDPDGEVIFCHEDQENYGIDDYWIKEDYLRFPDEAVESAADQEPDVDSFFEILSL